MLGQKVNKIGYKVVRGGLNRSSSHQSPHMVVLLGGYVSGKTVGVFVGVLGQHDDF